MEKLDVIIKTNNISNEDMEFIKEKLNSVDLSNSNKLLSLVQYIYNIEDIFIPRIRKNTIAKNVFVYLLNDMCKMTYKEINEQYKIDLRVVHLAVKKIKQDIRKDCILRQKIELIKNIMSYDNTNI